MSGNGRDMEKERHWRETIRGAQQSGTTVREYCFRHGLKESQFYWWQRTLKERSVKSPVAGLNASFALVSEEPGELIAGGIELVLRNGRRLRIGRGVDEQTLRTVLAVVQ